MVLRDVLVNPFKVVGHAAVVSGLVAADASSPQHEAEDPHQDGGLGSLGVGDHPPEGSPAVAEAARSSVDHLSSYLSVGQ